MERDREDTEVLCTSKFRNKGFVRIHQESCKSSISSKSG